MCKVELYDREMIAQSFLEIVYRRQFEFILITWSFSYDIILANNESYTLVRWHCRAPNNMVFIACFINFGINNKKSNAFKLVDSWKLARLLFACPKKNNPEYRCVNAYQSTFGGLMNASNLLGTTVRQGKRWITVLHRDQLGNEPSWSYLVGATGCRGRRWY